MRSNHSSRLVRIMGFFYFFVIVSLTARGLAALASKETLGLFVPDIYLSVSFVSVYLIMIVGNVGFILLLKEDSDKELFRLASYDDLTDTLNRRTFNLQGRKSLHQCAVEKSVVSFILMDVDFFKEINDRHGHHVGDQVLIDFSRKIHALLSEHALFGRYGGDEFGILLPHVDAGSATQLAEQIRSEIEHSTVNEWNVNYTVSLGIVTVQPDSQTKLEVLYIAADKALYEAKKKGRNCVSRADHATLEWGSMAISAMNRV
jgi:diguanylate cyclase (GGDEF)-like protein